MWTPPYVPLSPHFPYFPCYIVRSTCDRGIFYNELTFLVDMVASPTVLKVLCEKDLVFVIVFFFSPSTINLYVSNKHTQANLYKKKEIIKRTWIRSHQRKKGRNVTDIIVNMVATVS